MVKRNTPTDERALARRLKREALAERPVFSESLDRQIRRRVRSAAAKSASRSLSRPDRRLQLGWVAVAVAALVLVTTAAAIWWPAATRQPLTNGIEQQVAGPNPPSSQHGQFLGPEALPSGGPASDGPTLSLLPDQTFDQVDQWLGAAGVGRPWSELDHDARLAMEMLVDPLPLDLLAGAAAKSDKKF